jgi:hypothetical protein
MTTTGYVFPDEMEFEEWLRIAEQLGRAARRSSERMSALCWAVGDLLAYGTYRYGKKWQEAKQRFGHQWSQGTLKQMCTVSKRIERLSRLNSLPFWHYHSIARLNDAEERKIVAKRADEEGWTQSRVREEVILLKRAVAEADKHAEAPEQTDVGTARPTSITADSPYESSAPVRSSREELADLSVREPLPQRQPELVVLATPQWKLTPDGEGVDAQTIASALSAGELPETAICFLRVPPSRLDAGLAVMKEWGFRFQTCAGNQRPNPGEYVESNLWLKSDLEVILIGVRGCLPEVVDGELRRDDAIYAFGPLALNKKIASWLPGVRVQRLK